MGIREEQPVLPVGPRAKVLFVMSWQRSGSTLIDHLSGQLPGFFSVGELRGLWTRGLAPGTSQTCSCEEMIPTCPVWSRVLEEAHLGPDHVDPERVARWQSKALKWPFTWRILRLRREDLRAGSALASFADVQERLYLAIQRVTGARVLVDSSKVPSDAALVGLLPHVDPYFLHLVRDPRAVAFSWKRRKPLKGTVQPGKMRARRVDQSTLRWVGWNLAFESIRRRYPGRSVFVRYEDFVADPRVTLEHVARLVDEPVEISFVEGREVNLRDHHMVWGNPSRFNRGRIVLREDDEWKTAMSRRDHVVATLIAAPLLKRYGYDMSTRGA